MKVYRGSIITCDDKNTVAEYLVEDRGRIIFAGNVLPDIYADAELITLGKRSLIPSFVDTHIHFASFATFNAGLNVMDAGSNKEIMQMLADHVKTSKSKIIIVFGASPHSVKEKRLLSRAQIDAVCPDRPVFLIKYDGHACIINSRLLKDVESKISSLRGYNPETGEMRQEAFFAVSDHVSSSIPPLELIRNMQQAVNCMASKGIGMVHTVSGVGFPRDLDVDLEKWVGRGITNGFLMRLFFQTMDVSKVKRRGLKRIGGCFACALDGCYGSVDAALLSPYRNSKSKGVLYYSDEKVIEFCKEANRAGLQIELHAIGDAAFDQAARAMKAALDDYPRTDHRHGIIHACLPTKEGIDICSRYGISLLVQTSFIRWKQEPDEYLETILGKRAQMLNPVKTFIDKKILVAAGSDAPCTNPDPMLWIHNACNHSTPKQSITVYEALRMCTYNGCYASFDEKERGSLEQGKIADMVILSDNPYKVKKEKLKDIKVEQLILQGEKYREIKGGPVSHVLRGIIRRGKAV